MKDLFNDFSKDRKYPPPTANRSPRKAPMNATAQINSHNTPTQFERALSSCQLQARIYKTKK